MADRDPYELEGRDVVSAAQHDRRQSGDRSEVEGGPPSSDEEEQPDVGADDPLGDDEDEDF